MTPRLQAYDPAIEEIWWTEEVDESGRRIPVQTIRPRDQASIDAADMQAVSDAVQAHMDAKVRERRYDSILSACSYATSTNATFAAEGQACVAWRDQVWAVCYAELEKVRAGSPRLTPEEVIAMLPALEWPTPVL